MESVDIVSDEDADTQPIAGNADLSQYSQSQTEETDYWGRLYPFRRDVRAHDLIGEEIKFGKLGTCDIRIEKSELPRNMWPAVSKQHFVITRAQGVSQGRLATKVILTDFSSNGTFVNGYPVGQGGTWSLKSNDIIAVAKPDFNLYVFMESHLPVATGVPAKVRRLYDVSVRLGHGAFGDVSLVFNKASRKPYAMKSVTKGIAGNERKIESSLKKLENELTILQSIDHPNVIRLVDVVDCRKEKYLILEFMEGKDLLHRIREQGKLEENVAKLYFWQIACGVDYLHSQDVIHRDLKPANILMQSSAKETVIKITDFGLSKMLNSHTLLHTLCGTKMYVAPEVLECCGIYAYTELVDVWSMGVMLYFCLSGTEPFSADEHTIEDQIKKGMYSMPAAYWEGVSVRAKCLVEKMMTLNPMERITITDILNDPWIKDRAVQSKVEKLIGEVQNLSRSNTQDNISSSVAERDLTAEINNDDYLPDSVSGDGTKPNLAAEKQNNNYLRDSVAGDFPVLSPPTKRKRVE